MCQPTPASSMTQRLDQQDSCHLISVVKTDLQLWTS